MTICVPIRGRACIVDALAVFLRTGPRAGSAHIRTSYRVDYAGGRDNTLRSGREASRTLPLIIPLLRIVTLDVHLVPSVPLLLNGTVPSGSYGG